MSVVRLSSAVHQAMNLIILPEEYDSLKTPCYRWFCPCYSHIAVMGTAFSHFESIKGEVPGLIDHIPYQKNRKQN